MCLFFIMLLKKMQFQRPGEATSKEIANKKRNGNVKKKKKSVVFYFVDFFLCLNGNWKYLLRFLECFQCVFWGEYEQK